MLKNAMWLSAANSTVMSLQRVYLYSSSQAAFVLRAPMPYYYFHLSTDFFFLCLFTGVCVNFCSFAHYSGVKLVLSSQDLFMSAKLNTFHAIMQNYVIFFTGILITSQNKTYSVRLIIKNSKFYT